MTKTKVAVPEVGESIEEVVLATWIKSDGDQVEKDEEICEIESDKANMEIPAPVSGILKTLASEGDTIKIGDVIAEIDDSEKSKSSEKDKGQEEKDKEKDQDERKKEKSGKENKKNKSSKTEYRTPRHSQPADIEVIQNEEESKPKRKLSETESRERMSSFQRSMSKHLVRAKHETASITTYNEVDLTNLMAIRKKNKEEFQKQNGIKLGIMSFFVKAACKALKEFPLLNAQIEQDDIIKNSSVHMGIAISRSKGLVVPVLKNAEHMEHVEIEKSIVEMAEKAESGKLGISELTGGTFSITNGGVYGSLFSTPILNPPQVGILGMHKIENRPVAVKNETENYSIEVRPMMYLALTYDHRLVEGKVAVSFLEFIRKELDSANM